MADPRRTRRLVAGRLSVRRPQSEPREHVRLTSAADRREHRVREAAYAAAISLGNGECIAVCGHAVILCALATPPGPPCSACAAHAS